MRLNVFEDNSRRAKNRNNDRNHRMLQYLLTQKLSN